MIDFLEIKDANRYTIGIIDVANSIIWHSVYYGVGDFEIYAQATEQNVALLKVGNYVTRQNNNEVGIIETINFEWSAQDGYMITASGRFAKSLLDRRIIYKPKTVGNTPTNEPTILSGNVEIAVRRVVMDNIINCTFDSRRNIRFIGLAGLKNLTPIIVDENGDPTQKQVSYQNLMQYTDEVLQEYKMSANMIYNNSNKMLLYNVFQGTDRSTDNTGGNDPIVFSIEYDNLNSSTYFYNEQSLKNAALIGGEGEGLERFYTLLRGAESGLQLREMFVDASDINREYEVEGQDDPVRYTNAEYRALLNQEGQRELKENIITETFNGDINVEFGTHNFGDDYFLGDVVTVQDNYIQKYINTRIIEATEVQDENGYTVNLVFGE